MDAQSNFFRPNIAVSRGWNKRRYNGATESSQEVSHLFYILLFGFWRNLDSWFKTTYNTRNFKNRISCNWCTKYCYSRSECIRKGEKFRKTLTLGISGSISLHLLRFVILKKKKRRKVHVSCRVHFFPHVSPELRYRKFVLHKFLASKLTRTFSFDTMNLIC